MKKISLFLVTCILGNVLSTSAQEVLTADQAVMLSMEKNLGIVMMKNEAIIAANNASRGNAGMLPVVSVNGTANYANTNLKQEFSSGGEINKTGVASTQLNGNVALTWTIFDGMGMFTTYERLQELEKLGEIQVRLTAEETAMQTMTAYYDIVKQKLILENLRSNLAVYEERIKIAEQKLQIGKGSKPEVLQAQIDLNTQKNNILRQEVILSNAKIRLNRLLERPVDTGFEVEENFNSNAYQLGELLTQATDKNIQMEQARSQQTIADLTVREFNAVNYPVVMFQGAYNFTRNATEQGFFLFNQSYGPNAGVTLSWNIFNGGNTKRQITNAKLLQENVKLSMQQLQKDLETEVQVAFANYENAMKLVRLEEENHKLAKENLELTLQRFKEGEGNVLELKDAQRTEEAALIAKYTAQYDAKVAEIQLQRLTGNLLKS